MCKGVAFFFKHVFNGWILFFVVSLFPPLPQKTAFFFDQISWVNPPPCNSGFCEGQYWPQTIEMNSLFIHCEPGSGGPPTKFHQTLPETNRISFAPEKMGMLEDDDFPFFGGAIYVKLPGSDLRQRLAPKVPSTRPGGARAHVHHDAPWPLRVKSIRHFLATWLHPNAWWGG